MDDKEHWLNKIDNAGLRQVCRFAVKTKKKVKREHFYLILVSMMKVSIAGRAIRNKNDSSRKIETHPLTPHSTETLFYNPLE
jgi:hypothetical protein